MHANKQSQTNTGNNCGPVCLHAAHTTFPPCLHQGSIMDKIGTGIKKNNVQNKLKAWKNGIQALNL
jgi:hypothetical protein